MSYENKTGLSASFDASPNRLAPFTSGRPPPTGVKYTVEYRNNDTGNLVHSINTDRLNFNLEGDEDSHGAIFDIVTTFQTIDDEFKVNESQEQETRTTPRIMDPRRSVQMHIYSQAIIHALRSVVKYYPGQSLLGDTIIISEPYAVLVHHEEELNEYAEKCRLASETDSICVKEKDAYHKIKILQDFLEYTIMPAVRLERQRYERGMETFDMMWLRLKPGVTIKSVKAGTEEWHGEVVECVKHGSIGVGGKAWEMITWTLDYNGTYLGTLKSAYMHEIFEGEREISNNLIQPPSAFEEPLAESVKTLVEQGKTFFNLLSKKCQYYKGTTFDFPHRQIDSLVMVDMKKYYSDVDSKTGMPPVKPYVSWLQPDKTWIADCSCFVCQRRKEENTRVKEGADMFEDYHGIYPEDMDSLTPHQFFLLPHRLCGYVFKTRTWEHLHVSYFQEPKFEQDMIDKLVMDPARIRTLKALAGSYIRENKHGVKSTQPPWSADFIQGKGQGQIILLHGKPGVGKTCTAECIAQYTKRPLMVLTSSDIGADPEKVENILSDGFKTASSWGAVLLIDEADVFMERRSSNDLNRNCLVAGFLRALELYDGILFLTTNRVGAFDDAFISRIHVKLYYPDFTDKEREMVWQTFLDKLMKDRGKSIRVSIDAKDYIKSRQMREVKWNGREIRNAFQTAVALAEYDAEKDEEGKILLKDTHLSSIVDMSRDFKAYLDETHGADEDKRAAILQIRHDDRS